jgi:CRP/FNR family cyclic AMP-dependent transcriptional regulator
MLDEILRRWLDRDHPMFPKLRSVPLFQELNRRELQEVVQLLEMHKYEAGGVVFEQGTPGMGVYMVMSGCVELIQSNEGESDTLLLAQSESGSFFGETALLDDAPRTASAVVTEDTELALFPRSALLMLAEQRPHLGVKIAIQLSQMTAERLRRTNRSLRVARDDLAAKQPKDEEGGS